MTSIEFASTEFTREMIKLGEDVDAVNQMVLDCAKTTTMSDDEVIEMIHETIWYILGIQKRIDKLLDSATRTMPVIELIPYRFNMTMMRRHLEKIAESLLKSMPMQTIPS